MGIREAALFAALVLGVAVSSSSEGRRVSEGDWGGAHVRLTVHPTGAHVEFDCAHGTLDQAMTLDERGRFDAKGRYVREHGGPVLKDEADSGRPVRYVGSVEGRTMTLKVVLEDGETLGPFELGLGKKVRLVKCL